VSQSITDSVLSECEQWTAPDSLDTFLSGKS
jgi:hypothetical protein